MLLRHTVFWFLFAFLITNCANIRLADKSIEQKWIPFIEDGRTSKEEILLILGNPSGQFEGGRILTYTMSFSQKDGFRVNYERKLLYHGLWTKIRELSVSKAEYNLILVFDENNILSKHNLLKVSP